ncbi:sensor histidine kinase [[Ruminococcus] torques]|uniref:sensor histidine kinase n=1 Tax=[Ruminococcus] torques TaxID=33039 RepID=UPI00399F7AED
MSIIFIVVVLGFFEGNWKRKLFVGSSYFAFVITIEGIVALSIGYFFHIEASEMPKLDSSITQFFQRFLTELRLILVLVLYFFSRRKKNTPERKVQKSILIIPILSAVLIIYLYEAQIMKESTDLIFGWIVTVIVVAINIITYILFRKQEQYHIAEGEMKNRLKEYEYQKLHYEQVEQHQQEIRKIRHDMKNQIAGIYGYLETGELEEGKREIRSILKQLEKAEQKLFTANAVVNGILNMKYAEIEAKEIHAKFNVKLPEKLGICGTDLGILFGNILDNAIEACMSCEKEKWINLFVIYQNKGVVICCKNSCSEMVSDFHTRKADKQNHGLGLLSVKQIAEKYNGDVRWESEKASFTLNINLWETGEK